MIKVLLLDLDGVLRIWDPDLAEEVEAQYGLPAGSLTAAACAPDSLLPALTGLTDDTEWREAIARELVRAHGEQARAAVQEWMVPAGRVDTDVLHVVRRARTRIQVVLLTNATSRLENDLAILGLRDEIDGSVSSAQLGLAKPDPDVFSRAALRNELMFSEVAYVDADPANIATAEILGIRSHLYEGVGGLGEFVDELLAN